MNWNRLILPLVALTSGLALDTTARAAPLISIGDNTDVFFNGSSSLQWDSNLFRNEEEEAEDLVWTVSPGLEINVGRGLSNADLSIITRYDIRRYDDNDGLDTELFSIEAAGSYSGSRLEVGVSARFAEEKSASGDTTFNNLIESENTSAALDLEYRLSQKFSFGSGVNYSKRENLNFRSNFADREYFEVPFDIFYELTPKLDLILGYRYRQDQLGPTSGRTVDVVELSPTEFIATSQDTSAYDVDNHFFNIGFRGDLLPKLNGSLRLGYRTRDVDDRTLSTSTTGFDTSTEPITAIPITVDVPSTLSGRTNETFGVDVDLTWLPTPKVTLLVGASRDFGVGSAGESTEENTFSLSGNYSITGNFVASAFASYGLTDFRDGRKDNRYNGGIRMNYLPNEFWRFSIGYGYAEVDSNRDQRSNITHTGDVSISLRY